MTGVTEGTILKRGLAVNSYEGMLLKTRDQPEWRTPTLLVRFVNATGVETLFILTGPAREQFQGLEATRIYNMGIKGTCVRNNVRGRKYGITGPYDVHMQYPCTLALAKKAWPLKLDVDCKDFADLQQCSDGEFVDLVGRVLSCLGAEPTGPSSLMKNVITLTDGTYEQELELLGDHASCNAAADDVLLVAGAVLKVYKGRPSVATGYLTVVQINPCDNTSHAHLSSIHELSGEPLRKALRMTPNNPVAVEVFLAHVEAMMNDEKQGKPVVPCNMHVIVQFEPMPATFFDDDVPTVGEHPHAKYFSAVLCSTALARSALKYGTRQESSSLGLQQISLRKNGFRHLRMQESGTSSWQC